MRNFVIVLLVCALGVGAACSRDPLVAKRKYLASGDTYYKAAKFDEAAIEYANAVAKDPQDGDARYKLAQAYYLAGNTRAAFPQFIRAADILKDQPDVQLAAGQLLLKGGLFEDAKNRARIILQQDSASVPGLMLLGNALAGLKNLDEAVNVLERASSLDPDHVGLYTNLGVLELAQGDRSQAEAAFQKAVAVSNGSADAYLALGNFYRATSDYERAEQALKNALARAPQDVSVNQALASLYMEANRVADAEPYLKTVTTLAKDPQSRFALSDYYVSVARYSEAVAAIEPLAGMPDQFSPAMTRIALIQYMSGQRDQAYETIEKVLARSRRNGGALTAKARMLLADNDTDRALEAAKGAIEVDTGSVTAQLTMARILLARNNQEDARKALAEALKLDPNSLAAQLTLVEIHRSRGELY
jgi:tetratricopeptide (TPR) repeat protein